MKRFLAAVQFLTICPLPFSRAEDLGRSAPFFPLVGLVIGAVAAGLDIGLEYIFPVSVSSVLIVIFLLAVTGGLHMDGLADTADGFFSARPREKMLEIMRDSRTGPMGVMAIVLILILKITLLASVFPSARWWVLLMTPLAGRCALLINLTVMPYARSEGGLASIFYAHRSRWHFVWAVLLPVGIGWVAGGWPGFAAGLAVCLCGCLFADYVYFKIGGATGDTLGAACEICELVPAIVCVIWAQRGWGGL